MHFTFKKDGSCNVMAIGWGFVGVLWQKHVSVVAVRNSRFTHEFIEDTGEFTVNRPDEEMHETVSHSGEVSGRGELSGFTVPAINLRSMTYDLARQCSIECKKTVQTTRNKIRQITTQKKHLL